MSTSNQDTTTYSQSGKSHKSGLVITALPLVFFTLFFVGNGIGGWVALRSIAENQTQLNTSLENVYLIDELYIELLRAESGQRGYLVTELESYLEPYNQAITLIDQKLLQLENTELDMNETARLEVLKTLVAAKLSEMQDTINLVSANRDLEAIQTTFTHRGRNLMEEISEIILVMEGLERDRIIERSLIAEDSRSSALVVQYLSNLVGLIMVCLIYVLVRNNHLKEKGQADFENRAKTEFLANLSHEIRTPLTSIIGYTELLQRKYQLATDPSLTARLGVINRNSVHLLSLLNDTLDLSKIEAGKLEIELGTVQLTSFLADIISLSNARVEEKGLQFTFQQTTPLPEFVVTDNTRLRQILLNLISNAVKFTDKGKVTLRAGLHKEKSEEHGILLEHEKEVTRLVFDVEDSGRGIARKEQAAIFDPFIQGKKEITTKIGTGLGLTISRRLAEMLGGGLTVKSRLKKGSTFTLSIDPGDISGKPLTELNVETDNSSPPYHLISHFKGTVLIADDIEDIRSLVCSILNDAGIETICASNGAEALDILSSSDTDNNITMAILDINMPQLNGDEVATRLRISNNSIPLIALTAASLQGDRVRYLEAGFNSYISKPISAEKLLSEIERIANLQQSDDKPGEATALVIEDNTDARNALCDLLEIMGVNATGATSLQNAEKILDKYPIELVLTDLHLGKENGLEIARVLKGRKPELRVVVISGDSSILEKDNAIPPEVESVLIKPVTADNISKIVEGG